MTVNTGYDMVVVIPPRGWESPRPHRQTGRKFSIFEACVSAAERGGLAPKRRGRARDTRECGVAATAARVAAARGDSTTRPVAGDDHATSRSGGRARRAWRRVGGDDGHLLLVAPPPAALGGWHPITVCAIEPYRARGAARFVRMSSWVDRRPRRRGIDLPSETPGLGPCSIASLGLSGLRPCLSGPTCPPSSEEAISNCNRRGGLQRDPCSTIRANTAILILIRTSWEYVFVHSTHRCCRRAEMLDTPPADEPV